MIVDRRSVLFTLHWLSYAVKTVSSPQRNENKKEESHRRTHAFKESLSVLATGPDRFDVLRGCPAPEHRCELWTAEHHRRVYGKE